MMMMMMMMMMMSRRGESVLSLSFVIVIAIVRVE